MALPRRECFRARGRHVAAPDRGVAVAPLPDDRTARRSPHRFGLSRLDSLPDKVGLDFDFSGVKFGLFGFFLISMMILRPEGFIPNRRRKIELHEADATDDDALYAVRS